MAGTAALAMAAVEVRLDGNPTANLQVRLTATTSGNVGSQSHNLTGELVTRHKRIASQGGIAIDKMEISATDTTCIYTYYQFIRVWYWIWHTADSNVARGIDDNSSHNAYILSLLGKDN
jgi:hypothetical protein